MKKYIKNIIYNNDFMLYSKKLRLSTKFLLYTLPLMALFSALYIFSLNVTHNKEVYNNQKKEISNTARIYSQILSNPLWNIEKRSISSIMEILINDKIILCAELLDVNSEIQISSYGNCQYHDDAIIVNMPIKYIQKTKTEILGYLRLIRSGSNDTAEISSYFTSQALLALILLIVIIICTMFGFYFTVNAPLKKITKSVNKFQLTGVREKVVINTEDELGKFVSIYNDNIDKQDKIEKALLASKEKAEQALKELKIFQKNLIQSEKLASLGSLVAGIAHEINTPLGTSITLSSAIKNKSQKFKKKIESDKLKKSHLIQYLEDIIGASKLLSISLSTAAELINNFKQVAADQTSSKRRLFMLKDYIEEIMSTLLPSIKSENYSIIINIDKDIKLDSYPGALGQVITNLFTNSINHAFKISQSGEILITGDIINNGNDVMITFSDNGCGIEEKNLAKVFDPFFTTDMSSSSTGLGMNLSYNIVTKILVGSIKVQSNINNGAKFTIIIPKIASYVKK